MAMYGGSLVNLTRGLGSLLASWNSIGQTKLQRVGIFTGALFHQGIAIVYQKLPRISDKMHSENAVLDFPTLRVISLAASQDNFMYLIIDKATGLATVVDPLEPDTVLKTVQQEKVTLTSILTTHHHWDHAGGNEKLVQLHKAENGNTAQLDVYGGDDRILALSKKVGHQDIITVGSLKIECIFTPCHTTGHICYYVRTSDMDMQKPIVFTGDTLFVAGCGRFFEGTAAQMHDALVNKLGTLPAETLVFCGHEYTVANLKFVLYIDNNNKAAQTKLAWAEKQRSTKLPTIPSTIGDELDFNIFMRVGNPKIQHAINAKDAVSCMDKLRTMKNSF